MSDLIAWLRGCLDDDERVAQAAANLCGCHPPAHRWLFEDDDHDGRIVTVDDPHPDVRRQIGRRWNRAYGDLFAARHIARHDPDRVLARTRADRAILDAAEAAARQAATDTDRAVAHIAETYNAVVSQLAQPYAGRDGWREEWRIDPAE